MLTLYHTNIEILYRLEAEDLILRAGSNYSYCDGEEFNVSQVVVNEYYDSNQFWSDVALLKTETKIVYSDAIKRINLAYRTPDADSTAVISGYGGNEVSFTLQSCALLSL